MKMNNETKIGLMVFIVIVLLAVLTVKTGNFNLSTKGYRIKAQFENVDGVNLNSPVMFNGFEVGIVDDILIKDEQDGITMELLLWVSDKVRLREGSKAYIKNLGFMGEKYVGLTSGNKGGAFLSPGATIAGQEPPNFDNLLTEGQEIAKRLRSISENVDERLEKNQESLDAILANLDLTMEDLASVVSNINDRLKANENKIDDTVSNLHGLSVNLEELSYDLKLNPWKIMYRGKKKEKSGETDKE
ncbi:MAG TPA: MlaD family protein [Candidatus Omnitrophota bacterium]|nr:MlaD family protein [Candidatus Omnitrophota bacterium]